MDKVVDSNFLTFSLTMTHGTLTENRSITIDIIQNDPEGIKEKVKNYRSLLLNEYKTLFQPNDWRDTDASEDEWTTTGVSAKMTVKQEITFDLE